MLWLLVFLVGAVSGSRDISLAFQQARIQKLPEFMRDSIPEEEVLKLKWALDTLTVFFDNIQKLIPQEYEKELRSIPTRFPYRVGVDLMPDEKGDAIPVMTFYDTKTKRLIAPLVANTSSYGIGFIKGESGKWLNLESMRTIFNFERCWDFQESLRFFYPTPSGNPGYGVDVDLTLDPLDIRLTFWGNFMKTYFWFPALIGEAVQKPKFLLFDEVFGDTTLSNAILKTIDRINRNIIKQAIAYLVDKLNSLLSAGASEYQIPEETPEWRSAREFFENLYPDVKGRQGKHQDLVSGRPVAKEYNVHIISFNPDSSITYLTNKVGDIVAEGIDQVFDMIIIAIIDALTSGGGHSLAEFIKKVTDWDLITTVNSYSPFPDNVYILCTEGIVVGNDATISIPAHLPTTLLYAWDNRFNIYPGALFQSIAMWIGAHFPVSVSTLFTAPESPLILFCVNYLGILGQTVINIAQFPLLFTIEGISALKHTIKDITEQLNEDINLNVSDVSVTFKVFNVTKTVTLRFSRITNPILGPASDALNFAKNEVLLPLWNVVSQYANKTLEQANTVLSEVVNSIDDLLRANGKIKAITKIKLPDFSAMYSLGANAPAFPLSSTQQFVSDPQTGYSAIMKGIYLFFTVGFENTNWTILSIGNNQGQDRDKSFDIKVYRGWEHFAKNKQFYKFQFARPLKLFGGSSGTGGYGLPGCHVLDASSFTWENMQNISRPGGTLEQQEDFALILWRKYWAMHQIRLNLSLKELIDSINACPDSIARREALNSLRDIIVNATGLCKLCSVPIPPPHCIFLKILGIDCGGSDIPIEPVKSGKTGNCESPNLPNSNGRKNFAFYGRTSENRTVSSSNAGGKVSGGKDWIKGGTKVNTVSEAQKNAKQETNVLSFSNSGNPAKVSSPIGGYRFPVYTTPISERRRTYTHIVRSVSLGENNEPNRIFEVVFENERTKDRKVKLAGLNQKVLSVRSYRPSREERYELRAIINSAVNIERATW